MGDSAYILSCCSTADLTQDYFRMRDIHYICFHFILDGKEYPDDLGQSIPFTEFYKRMAAGAETGTSQVNIQEYIDYFESFLKLGKDIVHVTLSSGISGACSSARMAAGQLMKQYPDRKIYIIDSLGASSGYGLLMDKMADLRDEGMEATDLAQWAQEHRLHLHHWFFSTDLTFFIKGGRVSKSAGLIGGLLGICPLLNMDDLGRLIPRSKIRGKKKVTKEIVQKMQAYADGGPDYSGKCYISHSDCLEDARAVADLVEKTFPRLKGRVEIHWVGTTIGSHTGPGTVALYFWGSQRTR